MFTALGSRGITWAALGAQVLAASIGGTCTHYNGPLAEGLIVDDTVRCPWHHACFSLRSGEALRAPALNPVSCWRVEQQSGRAYVRGKIENTPPRRQATTMQPCGRKTMPATSRSWRRSPVREPRQGRHPIRAPSRGAPPGAG